MKDYIDLLNSMYKDIQNPKNLVEGMSHDEFINWLKLGTVKDIECAIRVFEQHDMDNHVQIMKIFINK